VSFIDTVKKDSCADVNINEEDQNDLKLLINGY